VLWLWVPFACGLVLGRVLPGVPVSWALSAAFGALVAAIAWRRRPGVWAISLGAGLLAAGAAYYEMRRARLGAWDELPPREARLTVRIERTFSPSADGRRFSGLAKIENAGAHLRDLVGQRIYFSIARQTGAEPPLRSAEIALLGVLHRVPRNAAAATFDGYLANSGVNFRLTRGRVTENVHPATAYRQFCARAQRHLAGLLALGLEGHRDLAAVSRAMLLGLQQELSEEQNQWFMRSGTMHLFSISGLHIAVIAVALESLLALVRLPRVARFLLGAAVLWLYVDVTGGAPSAVRAYLMVVLLQAAFVLRLPVNPIATLGFAAVVTLLIEPMQLFSASFQMSYGIVAALLLLGLPMAELAQERWQLFRLLPKATWRWWHHLLSAAQHGALSACAIGAAASLVSTVCGVIYFGLFTPGSFIANLALIPVGSLAILAGFVSMLCGLAGLDWLCATFNHAAALIIRGAGHGIAAFVDVPGVFLSASFTAQWTGFAALGLLLASLLWGYHHRWKLRRGGIWPPFVIVALALVVGVKFG
jgi:competence protein ComEC